MRSSFVVGAAAAGLLVLALPACRQRRATTSSPSPQASAAPASPSPQTSGPCPAASGGTSTVTAQLVAIRTGEDANFDRVVFEFSPASGPDAVVPSFTVKDASPPFLEDASGRPFDVSGTRFARIVFRGASGVSLSGGNVVVTYAGSKDLAPRLDVLTALHEGGDFERTLTWIAGLARRSCWRTSILPSPPRLVIELPRA